MANQSPVALSQRALSDPERSTLAEIGKRLGRTALQQVACVAKPDTILSWYRRLIARKFDGAKLVAYELEGALGESDFRRSDTHSEEDPS